MSCHDRCMAALFGACLTAIAAVLPADRAFGAEMTSLKVGISEPVNTVLAMWMAEEGGFYAAQGTQGRDST